MKFLCVFPNNENFYPLSHLFRKLLAENSVYLNPAKWKFSKKKNIKTFHIFYNVVVVCGEYGERRQRE